MMDNISRISVGLKKGAFFVSLTKRLLSADFVVLEHSLHRMSWGEATVYIMQKTTEAREMEEEDEVDEEA